MLIGKNIRRLSHNLIISKYFEEENNEIQNQFFVRNVADELSVISLGFGGFFVVINPCDFAIEYSSDTFKNVADINLVEVEQFEPLGATVFRIESQRELPKFNIEYVLEQLETDEMRAAFKDAIEANTGLNDQFTVAQGLIGANFETIDLDPEAFTKANYEHVETDLYKILTVDEAVDELEVEISKKKQELEILSQELAEKEEEMRVSYFEDTADFDAEFEKLSSALDEMNQFVDPEDLFAGFNIDEEESSEGEDNV